MTILGKMLRAFRKIRSHADCCCFVGLLVFGRGQVLVSGLTTDRSIVPGRDFPAEWAAKAGFGSDAHLYRDYASIERLAQRGKFITWLKCRVVSCLRTKS